MADDAPRRGSLTGRLYRGETSYDFIQRRKTWYVVASALVLLSLLSLFVRGLNLGIEFKGGASFQFPAKAANAVTEARDVVVSQGIRDPIVQRRGGNVLRVQTQPLSSAQVDKLSAALAQKFNLASPNDTNPSTVGPAWGSQITKKALQGLAVFLIAVVAYISFRFEPRMAAAAIVALIHDIILTVGIYAITGFEVTPSTVIALLTILGYSLYDTVVVFDKVQENTRGLAGGSRSTYSEAANLAVNQTLVRSINTSLIALLPVAALLFIGGFLLGVAPLKDLSLALFVGIAAGTYSSIFIATPVLTDLKEREPQYRALNARLASRQNRPAVPGRSAGGATRVTSSSARTATAVLERDSEPEELPSDGLAGGTASGVPDPRPPTAAATPTTTSAATPSAARPRRPQAQQQRRRKGGGRPGAKRRR